MIGIGVVDYRINNLKSIVDLLERSQIDFSVIQDKSQFANVSKLILPGVGAFEKGMQSLLNLDFVEEIQRFVESGRHLLGICLGMQLMFDASDEFGFSCGLGIIEGDVKRINSGNLPKVHMGWNSLSLVRPSRVVSESDDELDVYFAHSYSCHPKDESIVTATSFYGQEIVSVVEYENVIGVQFHPEKSQILGRRIISRFGQLS